MTKLPDLICTHCGRNYYDGETECTADDCPGLPLYLISCIEWTTSDEGGVVGYSHEMVYPNEKNKLCRGATGLELMEYQLTAMGIERFDYIQFEDELFTELQDQNSMAEDDADNYPEHFILSDEEKQAMILSEYQKRGCIEFRNEDLSIYWVKEVTEAEYAVYKRCVATPFDSPIASLVGKWLGERPEE
jgi:hypothetical protein